MFCATQSAAATPLTFPAYSHQPLPGADALTNNRSLIISSTGLLIVVCVVLDTMKQIEAQLLMRNYEGFIR